ncbi:MAG: minor capsid protein [Prevotellaceae bacterium]|nr:minor capsid protein [Candidatus Faecinaster equi]
MTEYWKDRQAVALQSLSDKNAAAVNKQIVKYYKQAQRYCVNAIENLYMKLPENATLNDFYNLDRYWEMEANIQKELKYLGDRTADTLKRSLLKQFDITSDFVAAQLNTSFATINNTVVDALVSEVWCADGLSWSDRIWNNIGELQTTLNEELSKCVIAGSKTDDLRRQLQSRFGVSYSAADRVIRTEIAHVQTTAAQQRYKDAGITEVEFYASADERECDECGALHGKRFSVDTEGLVPLHPFVVAAYYRL